MAEAEPRSRFETRGPSHQNAVDIFAGGWATDLAPILPGAVSGDVPLFGDARVKVAASGLGRSGRLDGMRILELGPLEGAHTYALEKLGADVLAIESNADAFLKCLIVKEITGIKAKFMLGDVATFLATTRERFDLVFACGVLYHMQDPISVIADIGRVTDSCYVWSHIYDESHYYGPPRHKLSDPRHPALELWEAGYGRSAQDRKFWGGNAATARWLREDDMLALFGEAGLTPFALEHDGASPIAAAISFCARRE